ncbi:hypothetical protein EVAR_44072_1 [Eumeta japonica]|uniref:Uncharacterized protein n=1 Tax=Eumeta variegata TaxID=151549 RepID=A0A4C1X4X6_EUMVA|nr:hypothetical protein EVAR_44072_1 [Eumeta japonica]
MRSTVGKECVSETLGCGVFAVGYCCHFWVGASQYQLLLLDRIQRRVSEILSDGVISGQFDTIALRKDAASLCMLYRCCARGRPIIVEWERDKAWQTSRSDVRRREILRYRPQTRQARSLPPAPPPPRLRRAQRSRRPTKLYAINGSPQNKNGGRRRKQIEVIRIKPHTTNYVLANRTQYCRSENTLPLFSSEIRKEER